MARYLFQCAIGPVQDFIASARRSRDLWYGSWMLSELSKAAAKALVDDDLIFPAPEDVTELRPDSDLTVANKVVAIVSEDPIAVGARVKKAVDNRLLELTRNAFQKDILRGPFDEDLAQRQLTDLVEYYWVGVPVPDGGYDKARKMADAVLASRKGTRNFVQFDGKPKPKSSLDGARESVIPESAYPQQQDSTNVRARKQRELYQKYGARRGERLSGVDLVKRQGKRREEIEQKFKSTSHMAAVPFLKMVCRERGTGADQKLLDAIRGFLLEEDINAEDKDGSLLYESRLREWVADETKLTDVRKGLKMLLEEHSGTKREPGIYYALLFADGDNMGKAISNQIEYQKHQEFSRALSRFSTDARNIIANHQGIPIFSGGDDVLAYLPLHTVLDCAQQLAAEFFRKMESADLAGEPVPTLSAGIAVAHHLTPLSDVLALARQAEKAAKAVPGKDALAIIVSKRSGVDRTIQDKQDALYPRLVEMIELLRLGAIGKGVAYELQELARTLSDADLPVEALEKEALRIVDRKRESGGDKRLDERAKKDFALWLSPFPGPANNGASGEAVNEVAEAKRQIEGYTKVVENLSQEIIVADIFAAALEMADGPLKNRKEITSS